MSKEYYFFQHKSGLYKQDLDFILSHKAEGYGIYMIALELIIESQFTISSDRLKKQLSRFADSETIEEVISSLIEAGEFYTNEDDSIQSSLLSQQVHKESQMRRKSKTTGLAPRIKKLLVDEGRESVIKKYKDDLTATVQTQILDSNVQDNEKSVAKFSFWIADRIIESRESK